MIQTVFYKQNNSTLQSLHLYDHLVISTHLMSKQFTLFEQFYTIQTIISLFLNSHTMYHLAYVCFLSCVVLFAFHISFISLMLLVILMTINILYSNYKQTYYFTIIRYFILYLTESTSIFIIVNTAYSISSALEHI